MIKIHLKSRKTEGAVVIILNESDEVLILKRPPDAHWAPLKWSYPGGKIEPGETPEVAAIRETKEETDLAVWNLRALKGGLSPEVAAYYTRSYEGDVEIDFEHTDWTWTTRSEIEGYDLAPGILQMYDWVLKNGSQ